MRKLYPSLVALAMLFPSFLSAQTYQVGNTTLTQSDVVTGITQPWEILWGPDDFIWCTTRPGKVLRIDPETGNYTIVLDKSSVVPNNGQNEPGMLGMAMHPDFANTPKVYIVYCYMVGNNTIKERLVSLDWNGTALVNETTLIDAINGAWIHNGSRLLITPDQKLLMSTGENGTPAYSQNLSSLNGKILRINLDGTIPADNPDPTSYVYSYGHRNGQGLAIGPNGIIYESEHGQNNSDELNIIEPNRNYGWNSVEGACNTSAEITYCNANNVKEPVKEWSPCVAVCGLEWYNHPAIPEWQNSLVMAVLGGLGNPSPYRRLSVLHMSTDGLTVESEDQYFASLGQRMRDVCFNPYTGAVYIALNGTAYPGNGSNRIIEMRNMDFVSVKEVKRPNAQSLWLYPNPTSADLKVEVSPSLLGATGTIYSYTGEVIRTLRINALTESINVSEMAAGSYYLSISNALGTVSKAFVVEK